MGGMRAALLVFLALLVAGGAWARRPVFIAPAHHVAISRAMVREQLCDLESHARSIQEATAHALRCALRFR
jgi:hypothetical protein